MHRPTRYEDFTGNHSQYEVGDLILAYSNGERRRFEVTGKYDDVKNGEAGWDGIWIDHQPVDRPPISNWGYDHQIIAVVG